MEGKADTSGADCAFAAWPAEEAVCPALPHDGATPHLILLRDPATLFGGVGLTLLGQFMEQRDG